MIERAVARVCRQLLGPFLQETLGRPTPAPGKAPAAGDRYLTEKLERRLLLSSSDELSLFSGGTLLGPWPADAPAPAASTVTTSVGFSFPGRPIMGPVAPQSGGVRVAGPLDAPVDEEDPIVVTPDGASITAPGVPKWHSEGPGPLNGGMVLGIDGGPVSGAVEIILPHPTNPDIIYLGTTGGGIWKTTDATASFDLIDNDGDGPTDAADPDERAHWKPLTDQLPLYHSITALVFDPNDPTGQTIYAGTGQASSAGIGGAGFGLLKSTDGGVHWSVIPGSFQGQRVNAIVVTRMPHASGGGHVILVATSRGLYRSTNDQGQFAKLGGGLPAGNIDVTDLKADPDTVSGTTITPGDPDKFYAAVARQGVFVSDNTGGGTWSLTPTPLPGVAAAVKIELAVSPAGGAARPIYAALIKPSVSTVAALADKSVTVTVPPADALLFDPEDVLTVGTGANAERRTVAHVDVPTGRLTLTAPLAKTHVIGTPVSATRPDGFPRVRLSGVFRWDNDPAHPWQSLRAPHDGGFTVNPGGQSNRHFSIVADPNDPFLVYVGGDRQGVGLGVGRLFRGDAHPDATSVWTSITHAGASDTAPHADSRTMVFDATGDILQGDDGGIFRLHNPAGDPNKGPRKWTSVNTDLVLTELYSAAWDDTTNQIIGGAQDNGVPFQSADDSSAWAALIGADGMLVSALDGNLYYSTQSFGFFVNGRFTAKAIEGTKESLFQFDKYVPFQTQFAINRFNPSRMLVGTGGTTEKSKQPRGFLYESIADTPSNVGEQLTLINGKIVHDDTDAFPSSGSLGIISAIVYGGMLGATQLEDVGYVGTYGQNGTGQKLFFRETGPNTPFVPLAGYPGTSVRDIAVDPTDWRKVYVLDWNRDIHFLDRAGDTPVWSKLTDKLQGLPGASNLQAIEVVRVGSDRVVFAGGAGGIFRRVNNGPWHEFGKGLPNVLVTDIRYNEADDVLLVATMGRGAWTINNASQSVAAPSVLDITGTDADDRFVLRRNPDEPFLVDVFHSVAGGASPTNPDFQVPLASLAGIEVTGLAGNDRLFIDPSFGAIAVPQFQFFGGTEVDTLEIASSAGNVKSHAFTFDGHSLDALDPWGQMGKQEITFDSVENGEQVDVPIAATVDTIMPGLNRVMDASQGASVAVAANADMPLFDTAALVAGFNGLVIETPKADLFPLLTASQAAGVTQLDNATSILRRLFDEGLGAFSLTDVATGGEISTTAALRDAIDGLDAVAGNVTLTNLATTDAQGNPHFVMHARVVKRLTGIVEMSLHSDVLGAAGEVHLGGDVQLGADVHLDISFGVDANGFFVLPSAAGAPALRLSNLSIDGAVTGGGRVGFLGVDVSDATLALDPGVTIAFALHDPGSAGQDDKIRLPELAPPNIADLISFTADGDPGDGQDDLVFDGTFTVSAVIDDSGTSIPLAQAQLPIRWADLSVPTLSDLVPAGPEGQRLREFLDLASQDVLAQLVSVGGELGAVQSKFDFDLPFLADDSAVTELIDLVGTYTDKVLDPLRTEDGTPTFDTLQDMVAVLADSLGLDLAVNPIVTYDADGDPDTSDLAFRVPMTVVIDPVSQQLQLADADAAFGDVTADLGGSFTFDFTFGYDLAADDPAASFFFRVNELAADFTAELNNLALAGSVGPLEASLANASVELAVHASVIVDNSGGGGDGLSLAEIGGAFADADLLVNTRLFIAATGISGFLGGDGLGISLAGSAFALGLFHTLDSTAAVQPPTQFAMDLAIPQASGGVALVGFDDVLSLAGGLDIHWNSDAANAAVEEQIGASGVGLNVAAGEQVAAVQGTLSVPNLIDFTGTFAFDLAAPATILATDLAGQSGIETSVFKLGGNGISAFAGAYENDAPAAGLMLENVGFALALMQPTNAADTRRYYALKATAGAVSVLGFGDQADPANPIQLDVTDLEVNINTVAGGTGTPRALDLSLTPIAVPTGIGAQTVLDYGAELLEIRGNVELVTDAVTVSGEMVGGLRDGVAFFGMPSFAATVGSVGVTAADVELHFEPPSANAPVLTVGNATILLGDVLGGDLSFTAEGLRLGRDGAFALDAAELQAEDLTDRLGLGEILPFDIDGGRLAGVGGEPITLTRFHLEIDGTFDTSVFGTDPQMANPVLSIGGLEPLAGGDFTFAMTVTDGNVVFDSLDGPVTVGFENLDVGPMTASATLTLGQFTAGVYGFDLVGFTGRLQVDEDTAFTASASAQPVTQDGVTTLDVGVALGGDFEFAPGPNARLNVQGFEIELGLLLEFEEDLSFRSGGLSFDGGSVAAVDINFGAPDEAQPLMRFRALASEPPPGVPDGQAILLNLDDPTQPFLTFGRLIMSLPALEAVHPVLAVSGEVRNFAIGQDFSFIPLTSATGPGDFGVTISDIPSAEDFGLEWIPLDIEAIGVDFGPGALEGTSLDFSLTVSGGLDFEGIDFPIRPVADVDQLQVHIGTLVDVFDGAEPGGANPTILDAFELDGFEVGVEPIDFFGAFTAGGKIGFENFVSGDFRSLVITLGGYFEVAGFGGGLEIIISEAGPVMGRLDVPLGIPLGPTGLLLSQVSGGFRFGGETLQGFPDNPTDLLEQSSTFQPLHFTEERLAEHMQTLLARRATDPGYMSWDESFTIAMEGTVTSIATPGILEGHLDLATQVSTASPGVSFLASGDVTAFGIPMGAIGAILDFSDLLNPSYTLAFETPSPNNPLFFLFPASAEFGVGIQTQGLAELVMVGLRAFVDGATTSAIGGLGNLIATRLNQDPTRPLARELFPGATGSITASQLKAALQTRLPASAAAVNNLTAAQLDSLGRLASAVMMEMFDAGRALAPDRWADVFAQLQSLTQQAASRAVEQGAAAAQGALKKFWDRFQPRLSISGTVQPTILGFPFGDAADGSIIIDKDGFAMQFTGSIAETLQTYADLLFLPIFGNVGIPGKFVEILQFGIADHLNFTVALDGLDNLFQTIAFGGGFPVIDPELDFSASFNGTLSFLGFDLASVSGALFAPGSSMLSFDNPGSVANGTFLRVFNLPLDQQNPGNLSIPDAFANLIPIQTAEDEQTFVDRGGILLTGQVRLPEMLRDPVGLIADMIADGDFVPPGDIGQIGDYVGNIIDQLTRDEEMGRLQIYVPSFTSIFDVVADDAGRPVNEILDNVAAETESLINEIFFRGFLTSKILSFTFGRASFEVTPEGIVVHGEIPWLLGLDANLTIGKADVNMNELVEAMARAAGQDVELSGEPPRTMPLPVAAATIGVSAQRMAQLLAAQFHLPQDVFVPSEDLASATLRLFSPGFGLLVGADPDEVSAAQRTGGVEAAVVVDVGGFIDDARFVFEAPLFGDGTAPSFHAEGHVDRLRIPGIGRVAEDILRADLHAVLDFDGDALDFAVDGSLRFLNLIDAGMDGAFHVSTAGIWGDFELTDAAGDGDFVIDAGLFKLAGGLLMRVNTTGETRDGIPASPAFLLRADAALSIFGGIAIPGDRTYNGVVLSGDMNLAFTRNTLEFDGGIDLLADFPFPVPSFGDDTNGDGVRDQGVGASGSLTLLTNTNPGGSRSPAVEGSFTVLDQTFTFDRFGAINGIGLPFIGSADQHVFVDDRRVNETDGTTSGDIVVRLSKPAERDLVVNYRLRPDTARRLDDYDAADDVAGGNDITGSVTIPEGQTRVTIPFDVIGDDDGELDERFRFTITSAAYEPRDDNDNPPPLILADGTAFATIVDDDPLGVIVKLEGAGDATGALETDPDGRVVFRGAVPEGGIGAIRLRATGLAAQDTVVVRYRFVPRAQANLYTATRGEDFALAELEGLLTLTAGEAQEIPVTTFGDFVYELNEEFDLVLELVQPAASAPFTTLAADAVRVEVTNNDPDQPGGSLIFYDFDDFTGGQHFTGQPKYVDPLLVASDFRHSTQVGGNAAVATNGALRFNGVRDHVRASASTSFALPTGPLTLDFWVNPGAVAADTRATILSLGGSAGLVVFLENGALRFTLRNTVGGSFTGTLGTLRTDAWQHVTLVYNGNSTTATTGTSTVAGYVNGVRTGTVVAGGAIRHGSQSLTLGATAQLQEPFNGRLDEVRVWTSALPDADVVTLGTRNTSGAESNLLINYAFDEGQGSTSANRTGKSWVARLGSSLGIFGQYGRPDWIEAGDSPLAGIARYTSVTRTLDGVPKVPPVSPAADASFAPSAGSWALPGQALAQSPYFTFAVGRDAPTNAFGSFDVRDMLAVRVDGVDFFNRAGAAGPTRWEIRSSRDGFGHALAEGTTVPGADFQHARVLFDQPIRGIHPRESVEFRLYGLDASGNGLWTIDNFGLIAGLESPTLFNSPPTRPPLIITTPIDVPTAPFDVVGGTTDPNGDPIALMDFSAPVGTLDFNGLFVYTPPPGNTSDVPLHFVIADQWGATVTPSVIVRMIGSAADDAFTTPEDTPISGNLLANDKLLPGQSVSVTPVTALPAGVTLNADGTFTFVPPANATAPVSFDYRVSGPDWSDTATVTITINPINDVPTAPNLKYALFEDTTLTRLASGGVLAGITDPEGDALTAVLVTSTARGTLTFNPDGSFRYVPQRDDDNDDFFTYLITDGTGQSNTGRVDLDIRPVNDAPVGVDDKYFLDGNTKLTVPAPGVLANDTDVENGNAGLKAEIVTGVSNGKVELSADGSFIYVPSTGFGGTDSFTYVVSDGAATSKAATVSLIVSPPNQPPTAVNDTRPSVPESTTSLPTLIRFTIANILANDSDPEGSPLTVTSLGPPSTGTMSVNGPLSSGTSEVSYAAPSNNFNGTVTIPYTVADSQGLTASATVVLTITPTNDAPVAVNDSGFAYTTDEDEPLNVFAPGILGNDTQPPGEAGPLTAVLVSTTTRGVLTLNSNGSLRYQPNAGFAGTDSFTYRARDPEGALSANTATVTITVRDDGIINPLNTVVGGYVAYGRLGFDANNNRAWDFTDVNGNGARDAGEPAEPVSDLNRGGVTTLLVPPSFDVNGNKAIDPAEGVLLAFNGVLSASLQPLLVPFTAPAGSAVLTPFTTVLAALMAEHGRSADAAQASVRAAFALPDVDLTATDPIAFAAAGGDDAARDFLIRHVQLHDTYAQAATWLSAAKALPRPQVALQFISALAARIADGGQPLDLSAPDEVGALLGSVAERFELDVPADTLATVAQVIAAGNAVAGEQSTSTATTAAGAQDFIESVYRVEAAAQGPVLHSLLRFAAGDVAAADLLAAATGAPLREFIEAAKLGPTRPLPFTGPTLRNVTAMPGNEGANTLLLGAIEGVPSGSAVSLRVNWDDGTVQDVDLPDGATSFTLEHVYADESPLHAQQDVRRAAVLLRVDGAPADLAAVAATVNNVAPALVTSSLTPAIIAGGVATLRAELTDPGVHDTFAAEIDWGDGTPPQRQHLPAGARDLAASHVFAQRGKYTVTLRLSDADGATTTRTFPLDVNKPSPPAVTGFVVDDGSKQRSMVRSLTVVFDQPVELHADLISLRRTSDGAAYGVAAENPNYDGRTWRLEFFGPGTLGTSLPDGRFALHVPAAAVANALGQPMAADYTAAFHRFFGDRDGDADVDQADQSHFKKALDSTIFTARYESAFDFNSDGIIGEEDLLQFDARLGQKLTAT